MSILNAFLAAAGGGFEYETGSFTPTSKVTSKTINFSKTHTKPPAIFLAFDATGSAQGSNYEYQQIMAFAAIDIYAITKVLWNPYQGAPTYKGIVQSIAANSNSSSYDEFRPLTYGSSDTSQTSSSNATRYYLKESSATIYYSSSRYLNANKKYIWVAIWLPDSWTPPA